MDVDLRIRARCICGSIFDQHSTKQDVVRREHAEWDATHWGPGHGRRPVDDPAPIKEAHAA